jgi:hypothetical protein
VPDCTCPADYFVVYGCREDHVAGPLCEGIDPLRAFQQSLQWLTLLYILFPFSYQRPPTPLFTCRQRPPKMFILVWWNHNMIKGIHWNWVKENESLHSTCFLSVWHRSNGFRETILKTVNFIFCYENYLTNQFQGAESQLTDNICSAGQIASI